MAELRQGTLLVADIGGYTRFLRGVELEHSHDLLADLLGAVVDQMQGTFTLAKLEGDAVFSYDAGAADGSLVVETVEGCYFAFRRRLRTIEHLTTCTCRACEQIPGLQLKLVAHHGEYVVHEVAGSRELVGNDVVLLHRLLKNTVTKTTGLRGYALFTAQLVEALDLDPEALGTTPRVERYRDVGAAPVQLFDLEARWEEEQRRRRAYVSPEQGSALEFEMPAPPAVVWDYLASPAKRVLWSGADRVDQDNTRGVRGVGTANHCVHGKATIEEEVLDWKPFDYCTLLVRPGPVSFLCTYELTPVDGGTRLAARVLPQGNIARRLLLLLSSKKLKATFEANMTRLRQVLSTAS